MALQSSGWMGPDGSTAVTTGLHQQQLLFPLHQVASLPTAQQIVLQVPQHFEQPPVSSCYQMGGQQLLVQPNSTHQQQQHLQQQQQQQQQQTTIFFAGVNPVAASETLLRTFANFGRVMDLSLFRPYKGCRTSKGCGLVVFSQYSEAAACLETLHNRYVWPGARSPMVVEFFNPDKQHMKRRTQASVAAPPAHHHMAAAPAPAPVQYKQQQVQPCMQASMPAGVMVSHSTPLQFNGCLLMPAGY